jgi:hypothetical protein
MKILKIFTLLVLFSLQAGATGYSHNMFVAHKKLQAGKECVRSNEVTTGKVKASRKNVVIAPQASVSFTSQFTNKLTEEVTLNERILAEGPGAFFQNEKNDDKQSVIVSKLVSFVRCVMFAFIGSPKLSNSYTRHNKSEKAVAFHFATAFLRY